MQQEIWFHKYQILGLLGRGGTANVYLAEHIKLKSYRVIKCISKSHPLYELQRNEAFVLKNLKHSCIPIIYDIEEDEEGSYIVEQYLEGITLKDYISSNGALREDIIIRLGLQLCDLIHYLHSIEKPVLYLDLKPDNLILSGMTLKLIDFGSAVLRDELADNPEYSGTKGYAAPELYRKGKIDERCDVYGIGMLLYYMATGLLIKGNSRIDNIDQAGNCSRRLKNIINNCLKYNPSQRYLSVKRLSRQLSAVHKDQFLLTAGCTVRIAVAGSQKRIGVTHFVLRLCKYAQERRLTCLYQERNKSGDIRIMKSRYVDTVCEQGICKMFGIPMLPYGQEVTSEASGYEIILQDFGCLTEENLEDFLKAEIKLVILGAKDWELENSENLLNMIAEYKDISYLFNYINGRQFQQVMKSMNRIRCFRIPYEPDPFARITSKNGLDLFEELFQTIRKRSFGEKAIQFMGGKARYETQTDAYE